MKWSDCCLCVDIAVEYVLLVLGCLKQILTPEIAEFRVNINVRESKWWRGNADLCSGPSQFVQCAIRRFKRDVVRETLCEQ